MTGRWPSVALVALTAAGLVSLVLLRLDAGAPVRLPLALVFLLLGPGAAVVARLDLDDPGLAVALAVALSVAVDMLVAQSMVWLSAWSAVGGLNILVALTGAGAVAHLARGSAVVEERAR